jgi:hypothetical protein
MHTLIPDRLLQLFQRLIDRKAGQFTDEADNHPNLRSRP